MNSFRLISSLHKPIVLMGLYIGFSILLLNGLAVILEIERINTFVIIPSIFILGLIFNFNYLKEVSIEYITLILIAVSGLISSFLIEVNVNTFYRDLSMNIGVLVSSFIPLLYNFRRNYYSFFFAAFFISYFVIISHMYSSGNYDAGIEGYSSRSRFVLNANMYSYVAYFGNISLFYLHEMYKKKYITLLLILFSTISIYTSFITMSRSGLLFSILVNGVYWGWVYKLKINIIVSRLITFAIISFLLIKLYQLYLTSYIHERVEYSLEHGDSRQGLVDEAIKTFMLNPFFGVGSGQFIHYSESGSYSHNSFSEMAVTQGIIGVVLLSLLFYVPIIEAFRCLKSLRVDKNFWKLNLLFYFTFIPYNLFYPFYKYTYSMMFFFLIVSFQKNLIKSMRLK